MHSSIVELNVMYIFTSAVVWMWTVHWKLQCFVQFWAH